MPAAQLIVPPEAAGHRLDRFLADVLAHLSRSRVQTLIREGHVQLNQRPAKPAETLRAADVVSWEEPAAKTTTLVAEERALPILYEDDDLLVLDKPAGLVTHPAPGHDAGTLVNALLAHCGSLLSGIGGEQRPGIVHRLDKDTSGCLVVAKNDLAHRGLSGQFAARTTRKTYLALVRGTPHPGGGTVEQPVGRHPVHRKKMAVVPMPRGRPARTDYRVRQTFVHAGQPAALVECRLHTGRTHQIRVHLKHLGYPILGDTLYGGPGTAPRQMLHAWTLGFVHPRTGATLACTAPLPPDFQAFGLDPLDS